MAELRSRCEIMLENYTKTVSIEALTMIDMARKEILPAVEEYTASVAAGVAAKRTAVAQLSCSYEAGLVSKLSQLTDQIAQRTDELELAMVHLGDESDVMVQADYVRDEILPKMGSLRAAVDEAETMTAKKYWPFPSYGNCCSACAEYKEEKLCVPLWDIAGRVWITRPSDKDLTVLSPVDRMTPGS